MRERVPRQDRGQQRAHHGARVAFFVIGLVSGSVFGRLPAVQERLDLSAGELAVAVIGVEGGALLGLSLGGVLASRCGNRRATGFGFAVYAPGIMVAALTPNLALLTVGLIIWAAANSVLDVALNAHGVELERAAGRPLLAGMHATQGLGLLTGAAAATAAATADLPLTVHFGVIAAIGLAGGLTGTRPMLPSPASTSTAPTRKNRRPRMRAPRQLLLLGALAFCAFLVDGVAANWVAVALRTDHDAAPGIASGGFLLFTAALVLGRAVADRIIARHSRSRLVQGCGAVVLVGTVVIALAPSVVLALLGWAVLGLGVAPLAPAVLGAAPDARPPGAGETAVPTIPAPAAIATVTTIGYLGSFTGAPAVGAIAEITGLSLALTLMAVAGVATIALARHLPPPST
jgi:MFS family permease